MGILNSVCQSGRKPNGFSVEHAEQPSLIQDTKFSNQINNSLIRKK